MNLTLLRQILARRPSPPGAGQPQPGQLNSHRPPPGRRPGRGGLPHGSSRTWWRPPPWRPARTGPAPPPRTVGGAPGQRRAGCRTPSSCASTADTTRPGSGSAATAARRCAAPGACPAARTWTRGATTSNPSTAKQTDAGTLPSPGRLTRHRLPRRHPMSARRPNPPRSGSSAHGRQQHRPSRSPRRVGDRRDQRGVVICLRLLSAMTKDPAS